MSRLTPVLCCLASVAGASEPATTEQPLRFAASVESVYVDVSVGRPGSPLGGLTAGDFDVRADGAVQQIELVARASEPLTTFLVFDSSASVRGEKLAALRAAGNAFLDVLSRGGLTALLTFDGQVTQLVPPGPDPTAVRQGLARMAPTGTSAVFDALFAAIGLAGRRPALVVLFSDGEDNVSWLSVSEVRAAAERSNALVHVVGVVAPGPPVYPAAREAELPRHLRHLRQIAEATGGRCWEAESPGKMRQAFVELAAEARTRYLLRFEPTGASAGPGWHRLEVRVKARHIQVRARHGYHVQPPS